MNFENIRVQYCAYYNQLTSTAIFSLYLAIKCTQVTWLRRTVHCEWYRRVNRCGRIWNQKLSFCHHSCIILYHWHSSQAGCIKRKQRKSAEKTNKRKKKCNLDQHCRLSPDHPPTLSAAWQLLIILALLGDSSVNTTNFASVILL